MRINVCRSKKSANAWWRSSLGKCLPAILRKWSTNCSPTRSPRTLRRLPRASTHCTMSMWGKSRSSRSPSLIVSEFFPLVSRGKYFRWKLNFFYRKFFYFFQCFFSVSFFLVSKLLELHGEGGKGSASAAVNADGVVIERPDGYEPPVLASVWSINNWKVVSILWRLFQSFLNWKIKKQRSGKLRFVVCLNFHRRHEFGSGNINQSINQWASEYKHKVLTNHNDKLNDFFYCGFADPTLGSIGENIRK